MRTAYENKLLPEEDMKFKNAMVDEFEWNGQKLSIYRNFEKPREPIDVSYKVYLLSKSDSKIERVFMVEKTTQLESDGAKHLLCEKDKKSGSHKTYPYGWNTDVVPIDALKKAVILVLEDKMKPGASSNTGK